MKSPSKAALLDVVDKASAFAAISEDRQAHLLPSRSARNAIKPRVAAPCSPPRHNTAACKMNLPEFSGLEASDAGAPDVAPGGKLVSPTEEPMGYMSEVRVAGSLG